MTHIEAMKVALKRAFQLGQVYRSWADSEYSVHWKKADAVKAEFDKLVEDTLRTIPPAAQRQWVGLTDEQKCELVEMTDSDPQPHHLRELIDVTEAKLKEKNT